MEQILVTKVNGSTYLLEDRNAFRIIQSINQKIELRSNDIIDINLESREFFSFTIGDSFTYFGKKYTLNQIPKVDKVHSNLFRYSITFEGVQFDLRRASYDVNIDTTGSAIYGETLTANLELFLRVLIENVNRVFPGKWALGAFPNETETKTLTFSEEENCLSVLQTLCNEYDYDFTIKTENGVNILNILQVGQEIALEFKVGFQQGLYNLSRDKVDSNDIVTRLKVYGSSQNLGTDYRSNRLVLKGKNKPNSYIDNTAGITKYGIYEQTKIFEDIYPRRKGKVTAIDSNSVLKFKDSSMDFDLKERDSNGTKYLLDGVSAKIHFNTGNLAGYEFEISDYNHSTKEFTIIKFTDENDYTFPATDNNVFRISVNDEYVILDIKMPQSYIDNAEAELLEKGTEFLADKQEPLVQYTLDIDTLFLQRALNDTVNEFFQIGDFVKVIDTDLELNRYIRIKAIERNLNNPFDYKLTLSDAKVTASLSNSIISDINTINNIIRINNLNDPARAKRNWKDAQEVLDMVFDVEGDYYTEKIKPNSIETMHLQVGAKSMQFNLVDSRFEPNLNGNPNLIQWSTCKLIHFTIEETIKEWQITAGNKTLEANKPYYIYARCNKNNNIGVIEITETQYKVDTENYYYFLIGILNSYDSTILAREISLMYGFSTISGRFIKTGRIQSADGGTYFDLDSGEFKGRFTFSNGQSVEDAIIDQEIYIEYSVNGTSNWHSTFVNGDLYMRQKKGNGAWSNAIRIVGERGASGNEGRYVDYQFAKNTSSTTAPTTGWQDAPPAISDSEFLWMRSGEVIPPATSPTSWSTPTRLSGVKGEQGVPGIQGPAGANGQTLYTWVKYATNANGSNMSDLPDGKTHIGLAYNKTTATESTVASDYTWSLIKGEQGNQGVAGPTGADGQQLYTWIKYATTPTSGMSDDPTGKLYMGIAYNKTTATESSSYSDYSWSLIKGEQGVPGIQGPAGANGQSQFIHVRYSVNSNGSSMTTTPTATTAYIGIANTTSSTAPTSNTAYTWSKFRGDDGSQGVQGIQGPAGANGQSLYTWVKYADTPTSGITDYPEGKLYIGLAYNKATQTESSNYSDYTWSLMPQNIEIGGRNLLLGTQDFSGNTSVNFVKDVDFRGFQAVKNKPFTSGDNMDFVRFRTVLVADESNYTMSFWAKANEANVILTCFFTNPSNTLKSTTSLGVVKNSSDGESNIPLTTEWTRYFIVWDNDISTTTEKTILFRIKELNKEVSIAGIMFSKGNKAIDWSPAPEDVQQAINTAQNSADSANANLANYASDNVLTALEKKSVQTEWNRIKAEYANTITSANSVSVSTTSLTTTYNTLNSYITPLLADLNSNSTIVGTTFRANFKSFYDTNNDVLKAVYLKLNSNVTAVNAAVVSAQNSADSANASLANIANDNILTASEKQSTLNEWNRIKAEYNANLSLGTTLGVSTTSLTISYNALNTYITPLLSSLTTNSTIVGATFRTNFSNYYSANVELLKSISVKLQSNIDSIEIGGRNLLPSTNPLSFNPYLGSVHTKTNDYVVPEWGTSSAVRYKTSGGTNTMKAINPMPLVNNINTPLGSDVTVSVSVYFKNLGTEQITINTNLKGSTFTKTLAQNEGGLIKFEGIKGESSSYLQLQIRSQVVDASLDFAVWRCKVEYGNKCTDWTPAPEDVDKAIASAQSSADSANELLSNIASDNVLTASEKMQVTNEWNRIKAEYSATVSQATSVSVTYSDLTTKYNTLNSYITPLLASITSNSTIVGATFRTNFSNYYSSVSSVLQAISIKLQSNIDSANTAIINAQNSANTANNLLTQIASDSYLTPSEKQQVSNEWNRIKSEYTNNLALANSLSVLATDYTTRYNILNTYITPLLTSLTTTSEIVGSTFRTNFSNYYSVNISLLNAISTKLQSNIDNIQVGGRNLLLKSDVQVIDSASYSLKSIYISETIAENEDVTITIWGKLGSDRTRFGIYNSGGVVNMVSVYPTDEVSEGVYKSSFKWKIGTELNTFITIYGMPNTGTSTSTIYKVKLERGNRGTDWSPAPEDVNSAISDAQSSADSANTALSNIASDNVLTASEKQQVANEWNRIKGEYTSTTGQATAVSVTYATLTTAYNTLNTYITPLIASLTSNSTIVGTTFRANFKSFYDANNDVLKAVSIKLQSNIDSANTAITNAQNSANSANNLLTQIASDSYLTASEKQQVSNEWNRIKSEYTNNLALANSLSVLATDYTTKYNALNSYITPLIASLTTTSAIVGATFRTNFSNYYTANIELLKNISLKLQANNQANTNAIAETNAEVARAQSAIDKANAVTSFLETTIDGNVISTGMLQVGEFDQANAGISGLKEGGSNSIRFWAGDKSDNRKVAPFRVQDDGKVFMTNAYVQGEVYATSGTFSGTVRATEGYIGGFEIKDNILKAGSNVAGVWFDSIKDNSFTSVKVGNYIGDGIPTWNHQGNNLFPVISIEGNDTDNLNLFRAGVYINLNLPDNSIVSKPAIQIDNGHISGIALPINSYIHNETINTNADVAVFNTNGSNFNNVLYLPDTPRIGKILTIMNVDSGASSLSIRSRNHNIGKGRYGASNSYSLSKSGTFIFIGNIWILISETSV